MATFGERATHLMEEQMADIPLNFSSLSRGREYMVRAMESGHTAGDGPFTERCQALLEYALGAPVLLTGSGTHALELAALLLDLEPGDEVILPSFTFPSTANAFVLRGAIPVFADVRADTLNIDETIVPTLVTERTRAIVPVHYGGVACAMDAICETAEQHGIAVVEDNAHGLFSTYRSKMLGTIGLLGALSFHQTKSFTCGEGGALIVADPQLRARAEVMREKGTDRRAFLSGAVESYSWKAMGSSYILSDVLAAGLLGELEARKEIAATRTKIWERYAEGLADWAANSGVQLPVVPEECEPLPHLFHLVADTPEQRLAIARHLEAHAITSAPHYQPLHLSAEGTRLGGYSGQCPVTESIAPRLLRLPLFNTMSDEQVERVVDSLVAFSS